MDLKPCPFCGEATRIDRSTCVSGQPGLVVVMHPVIGWTRCNTCMIDGPHVAGGEEDLTETRVIEAWNQRVAPEPVVTDTPFTFDTEADV